MGGDGYALALGAGAELIDMEFVQFFPIGHLAPRLVGMDPIMWDPFRYKLGGRLLDGAGNEFLAAYGSDEADALHHPARPRHLCDHHAKSRPGAARRMAGSTCRSSTCRGRRWRRHSARSSSGSRRHGIDLAPRAGRGVADRALPHGRDRG